jgi:hypothetical protein
VATDVVPATNDKQQLQPMPSKLGALAVELGKAVTLLNRVHFENLCIVVLTGWPSHSVAHDVE